MIIGISGKIKSGKDTVGLIIQSLTSTNVTIREIEEFILTKKIECNTTWQVKKFADKLKDIVCLLINCTREQLEDQDFKNRELGEEWKVSRLVLGTSRGVSYTYFNNLQKAKDNSNRCHNFEINKVEEYVLTPRLLLQLLGTECGRNIIHPNIWVNVLMSEYKKPNISSLNDSSIERGIKEGTLGLPNWIITDMRFPNELKAIKDKNGITIRIITDSNPCVCIDDSKLDCLVNCDKKLHHPSEIALDNAEFDYKINNSGTIEDLIEKVKIILIKENII